MSRIVAYAFALVAALAFAAGELAPQTSNQAGVTVKVTPHKFTGAQWEFSVAFDTHTQELSDDLMKSAVLAVDGGTPSSPTGWHGDAPGGHHRKGVLSFKAPVAPAIIELQLQRPGERAPRVFRWKLR